VHRLSQQQQEMVLRHQGLVRLHIVRYLRSVPAAVRRREAEDLYQEGLIGLMEAVWRYDPSRHGPFAAFALPYIHGAISRYLLAEADGIAVPASVAKRLARKRRLSEADAPVLPERIDWEQAQFQLVRKARRLARSGIEGRLGEDDASGGGADGDWPGKVRAAYERAVNLAAARLKASRRGRADRNSLIDAFVQERLLVPEEQYRTSKRALARRFGCSLGRVNHCEQRLFALVREILQSEDALGRAVPLGQGNSSESAGADCGAGTVRTRPDRRVRSDGPEPRRADKGRQRPTARPRPVRRRTA